MMNKIKGLKIDIIGNIKKNLLINLKHSNIHLNMF